ncbi:cation diffusion facilitator CzcD-associated flavoprotein CzcO [Branchiibius hedensis]|uniref:Predicted flavoprotein CzcO associated with the cation diffusion facilitator CzcD n=1 Tax=Branchiibius hedensis TaxID=672460 RepID=A0A2Y8ZTV8_9MICO|nr:NAD(P)-binding domain-containing protein [Branchiibius hedensis]PWJ27029.1 cation diffusion facilitator CzcD-associated flavoprotein CzcO [Branchiibius hedensis]SSA35840.1 Predicted flavoprotein CzcO associated with the cation diffusion facilitator CzcD [Branchiibius hedensis]
MTNAHVCIIGAGCSGITTAKRLKEFGISYDQFEMSDDVGGNWYFRNPNGRSSVYESLHIDTSTARLEFEDFPAPPDYPDFPHHTLIHDYFKAYVDEFGLRPAIEFNTEVERASRRPDGGWDVRLSTGETRSYTDLVVANGHHWKPSLPDWPGEFDGDIIHSHHYVNPFDPIEMRGKRVIVVGLGNSALDIASELSSPWMAEKLYVSARRGVWVLPKYRNGVAADKVMAPPDVPKEVALEASRKIIRDLVGSMSSYGLPEPDHEPLAAHPSVSADFLTKAGSGDIHMLKEIVRLDGKRVCLADGSSVEADVIVAATGYDMSFPFFDDADTTLHPDSEHRYPLFKRMMKPGLEHLYFVGLAQSSPTIVNLAEQQSKLLARLLTGQYVLPSVEDQERIMVEDEANHLAQYYAAHRHTIQIDFARYVVDLLAEIEAGEKRALSTAVSS